MQFNRSLLAMISICLWVTPLARASEISVTVVAGHPSVFRWVKHLSTTFIPSVDTALQGSDTRMAWTELYGGTLAPVGGELEVLEEGLAEIGVVPTPFEPSKLSAQNVTYYTPFVSTDVQLMTTLLDELQHSSQAMQENWTNNGLEYLGGAIGVDDYLLMTNFPVNSLADLKGRKIAAPGPAVNWLKGTGAVGVASNLTLYYNDISTGVYDGVITFATAALPGKLHEVAPHVLRIGFGAQYGGGVAANKDWFDAQPVLVRQSLKMAAQKTREAYLNDLNTAVTVATDTMASEGAKITDASLELRTAWVNAMPDIAEQWANSLDDSGQDGRLILDTYMQTMRQAGAEPLRDWDKK